MASARRGSESPCHKVVVDADVLGRSRGGDETYVRGLLLHLPAADDTITYAASTRHPESVPSPVRPLDTGAAGHLRRLSWTVPRWLRAEDADLYHGNYFLPPTWSGRTIVTVHDISFARRVDLMPPRDLVVFRTLVPRALRRADAVFTVSEWAKSDIVDRYGTDPARIVVTPNGIATDLSPDGERPDRPPYLLFVGGSQPRKDPGTAIRALARCSHDVELVIVGRDTGADGAIGKAARSAGVADRVHEIGYADRTSLCALYRGAEALVFPSLYEGFGIPVIEAMASGTPVIAAATTSLPEIAGGAANLVSPGRPDELAAAIDDVLEDPRPWIDAGLARAKHFNWTRTAEIAAAAYRRVLS